MVKKKRTRKPAKAEKKQSLVVRGALGTLVFFTLLAIGSLPGLFERAVVLPACGPGTAPGVVADTTIDGRLVRKRREYVIRDALRNEHSLATQRGWYASRPYGVLENSRENLAVHAEFCGPFVTLITLDGVLVYTDQPPTQPEIDQQAAMARYIGCFGLVFLLTVLLGSFLFLGKSARQGKAGNMQKP